MIPRAPGCILSVVMLAACEPPGGTAGALKPLNQEPTTEKHLKNIRQLTNGGENAEAYFSGDGKRLIFQSKRAELKCDQIFTMDLDGLNVRQVSTGKGRTTCSYFFPDGSRIIYASTHESSPECPPEAPRSGGYFWAISGSYEIYSARPDGSDLRRLTNVRGYDAEGTISPDGKKIVFTSVRDGDLDLYVMNPDGSHPTRLTHTLGYDGGAFFSPDGTKICFRASRPRGEDEKLYRELLASELVKPAALEIFVMNADGTDVRQITKNGAANFCPFFHPSGTKLLYASNQSDPRARSSDPFDIYLVHLDGSGQEKVTIHPTFDAFPMFSPDGKKLVWASNRNSTKKGETNIFLADWVD